MNGACFDGVGFEIALEAHKSIFLKRIERTYHTQNQKPFTNVLSLAQVTEGDWESDP